MTAPSDDLATGELTDVDGTPAYRIDRTETMEPFLTTVVSDTDLWMFTSSAGPLTAGRRGPDGAMFPYVTDDRLHRAVGTAGPVTIIERRDGPSGRWRPFGEPCPAWCRRAITKGTLSDVLVFEEHHADWGLTFRASWTPAPSYGWVREVEILNHGTDAVVDVVDGLLDVMPAGIDAVVEQTRSNLVDAYKRSEAGRWGSAAIYTLESLVTDRAEPGESLAATVVWSMGFPTVDPLLDERAFHDVLDGRPPRTTRLLTGRAGAYLLAGRRELPANGRSAWTIVADTGLDRAALASRVEDVSSPGIEARLEADIAAGRRRLHALVAGADGMHRSADPVADAHHESNVLFNSMRGGVFPHAYDVPVDDLVSFVGIRNRVCRSRHVDALRGLGEWTTIDRLHRTADERGDPDLLRLVLEYLPLTFARRHGDPSRPWNTFSIEVRDETGGDLLTYEGNWRDIFQNWEALLQSYPEFFPHVVAKFVNATTADGHNAYRITRDGIDWEVPDPDDPWSNIGYWGDHQIVYLLRLLEGWQRFAPGELDRWLDRRVFVYADVPYSIADHDAMVTNPHDTITYDHERARSVAARESELGTDGRLAITTGERVASAGLFEKLLVPALAKLSAFVPGGGIWMNTQRPEWNDANNALAGNGLSVVTLAHLVRYLGFLADVAGRAQTTSTAVSPFVDRWLHDLIDALERHDLEAATDDRLRREAVDDFGRIGTAARHHIAAGLTDETVDVPTGDIERLCTTALTHLRHTLHGSRRDDGLFHSYDRISFPTDSTATIDHLGPMLEGQVAALSSGELDGAAALAVVDTLYDSEMYCPERDTFMLYPALVPPSFLDRNTLGPDQLARAPFLAGPIDERWRSVFVVGTAGELHFRPAATNAATLRGLLDGAGVPIDQASAVQELYEELFDHSSFTGRSGAMYGFEGIGSVYWHMVAKLLLAVQEQFVESRRRGEPAEVVVGLAAAYRRIRDGLGFRTTPGEFGAFPTDCYSHTPSGGGARQPGMTGQVKEEILTRLGELGLHVADGTIRVEPTMLDPVELFGAGLDQPVSLTFCGTPFEIDARDDASFRVTFSDGRVESVAGDTLPAETSAEIFSRSGTVARVAATVPAPIS